MKSLVNYCSIEIALLRFVFVVNVSIQKYCKWQRPWREHRFSLFSWMKTAVDRIFFNNQDKETDVSTSASGLPALVTTNEPRSNLSCVISEILSLKAQVSADLHLRGSGWNRRADTHSAVIRTRTLTPLCSFYMQAVTSLYFSALNPPVFHVVLYVTVKHCVCHARAWLE